MPLFGKLSIFAKQRMGFERPPKLFLKQDAKNSNKILGKTAHYNPQEESITLYVTGRHPKDILRSFAHELVHHSQNLRGDLSPEKITSMGKNYAQEDSHMRKMEKEAYLKGNMCFRDWEDGLENKDIFLIKLAESKFLKENKTMTTKITNDFLRKRIKKIILEQATSRELDVGPGLEDTIPADLEVKDGKPVGSELKADLEINSLEKAAKEEAGKGASREEIIAMIDAVLNDPNTPSSTETEDQFRDNDSDMDLGKTFPEDEFKDDTNVAPKGPNESSEIFAPNHYCIHHGGVQHEGKIVAAEAIQHVEPDENGFISHYDMKLSDGTILEDIAAEDIQITNATLEANHGKSKRDHKPMKKKKPKAKKDHDGDGKIESGTEEYLGSRDKAIKASMAKKKTKKESKIQTPEQENTLYEQRFAPKNNRLFEKLLKEWTK